MGWQDHIDAVARIIRISVMRAARLRLGRAFGVALGGAMGLFVGTTSITHPTAGTAELGHQAKVDGALWALRIVQFVIGPER
jgi:hypothetical protein